jgi:hypothetical protein
VIAPPPSGALQVEREFLGVNQTMSEHDRELFAVMNDSWKVTETSPGFYELAARDGSAKLGPMEGDKLVGVLAVISDLERRLREGR